MEQSALAGKLVRRLFEDEHYLFVAKPAGLAVGGPRRSGRAGVNALATLFKLTALLPVRLLSEHTSGVLPLAKSPEAAARLADSLRSPRAAPTYQAVVEGSPQHARSIGRGRGKAPSPALELQVLRRRHGRSLVAFRHPATRIAEVRADLRAARLELLGEIRQRRDKPPRRQIGRLFLHRAEIRVRHPYTGKSVTVTAPLPQAFAAALSAGDLLEDYLQVALQARLPCLLEPGTDAFRLFTGKFEGIPGLVAEKGGPVIVLQTHQGKFQGDRDRIRRIGKWYARTFGAAAVYHKRFIKGRDRTADDDPGLHAAAPLMGRPIADQVTVRENDLLFLIRPHEGYSMGLFLDQRENRCRIGELAAGKRVLNAFAYTCGFSVAAAAGGADHTVSVDISARALDWGRRNFAANGISLDNHLFLRSEVFSYLARARRQNRSFEVIILDAPTFARSKRPARVFAIDEHLEPLVAEAAAVLAPGGTMLVCTNKRGHSGRWLGQQIAAAAARVRRPFQVTATPTAPPDFAADPDHAKSVFVRFA